MGLYTVGGTRRTKAALATTTVADPEVVITEDLIETRAFYAEDPKAEGSIKTVGIKAGTVVRQSYIDNVLFPPATVVAKSPETNALVAGGTVYIFTGTNLDGVSGVTFGGTAGTSFSIIKVQGRPAIQVTAPAKTAGTYDVVFADDAGPLTKTGFVTYA